MKKRILSVVAATKIFIIIAIIHLYLDIHILRDVTAAHRFLSAANFFFFHREEDAPTDLL